MFPRTFKLTSLRGERKAELFGDLITRIEQYQRLRLQVDTNKKAKVGIKDKTAPGANHGSAETKQLEMTAASSAFFPLTV